MSAAAGASPSGKRSGRQLGRNNSDEAPPKKKVDAGDSEDSGMDTPRSTHGPADQEQQQLKQYIDSTRTDVMESLRVMQASLSALSGTMSEHCKAIDKAVEKMMCKVEHKVAVHDTRIDKLEKEVQELRDLLGLMRREEAPRPQAASGGFDREIDSTISMVRTREVMPKAAIARAVQPWLEDSNLGEGEFTVEGEPADTRYQIVVKGARGYAARKVSQAISSLRLPGRGAGWWKITAQSPLGAEVELSISPDKSPKQVARELGCKKIVRAIADVYPNKKYFVDRGKGVVSSSWKDLISFEPTPGNQPPIINFSDKNIEGLQMSAERLRQAVGSLFGSATETE
ncbi:unnamed protein product, partial [Prorocentrum cordatum]